MPDTTIIVYESTLDKGKVSLSLGDLGSLRVSQTLTVEQAECLAADILRVVGRMPRHREGCAADLGCEVL